MPSRAGPRCAWQLWQLRQQQLIFEHLLGDLLQSDQLDASVAGGAAHGALPVAANPQGQLKFDTSSLSAKAGKVTIAFTNSAPLQHNFTIEQGTGTNGTILGSTPTFSGGTRTIITNLTPGTSPSTARSPATAPPACRER